MKNFLSETQYCDFSNPKIHKVISEFKDKYKNENELAIRFFYYVRDNTKYRIGNWNKKASETISEGAGTCTNNANLMVALLRGTGIPAGYGVMRVNGREYFGPIVPEYLKGYISEISVHVYCYVYLNDKWIKCDPSDDEIFSVNTQHFNPQSTLVEWDGESNAMINLDKKHILSDSKPIANIDHMIGKKADTAKGIALRVGNFYIDFLRTNGRHVISAGEAHDEFLHWLQKKHYGHYLTYKIVNGFRNFWNRLRGTSKRVYA